jgi:chromosome segregation ATPase
MLKIIVQEGKQDKERKDWCNDERDEKTENLDEKKDDIASLDGDIEDLDETIDDPETGLKEQIKKAEEDLDTCRKNMKDETSMRREDNAIYQKDIDTLVQGEEAIKKAHDVLDKFYKALEEHNDDDAFVQVHKAKKEDPDAPEIMEEDFAGQSDKGGEVLDLLQEIYDNMRAQEARCHEDEQEAQHDYEDSMTDFKDEEADLRESIIKLTKDLKDAEKSLESKHKELTKTEKEKMKLEQYLEKIEPGCDFVVDNFDERESNRETESEALEKAKELLEDSPMFKQAQQAQKEKGMGDCKDTCLDEGDNHAKCKACLAGVSVPGYCVDHGDAPGC